MQLYSVHNVWGGDNVIIRVDVIVMAPARKTYDKLGPKCRSVFWSLDWVIPPVPSM